MVSGALGVLGFLLPVFLLYSALGVSGFFLLVLLLYSSCCFFLFLFNGCWVRLIILSFSVSFFVCLSFLFCLDIVDVWILILSLLGGGGGEWLMGV